MADDKRITELPDASLPIASGVKFEAVQGGVNVKVDADDMPGGGGGAWGSITGTLSSQTDLNTVLGLKAPLASPALTGVPTAPTAAPNTSTTQLATTEFVNQANERIYNVEAFGALHDYRTVLDANITSGTATLTSATAGFTSADTGKKVRISGAGAAGIDLIEVMTFVNSTTVTIGTNASTTIAAKKIEYGTDDTAFIQAAIDACFAAGGGTVYFPLGLYCIAGSLITSLDAVNPNCQIYIPLQTDAEAPISIRLLAESPALILRGPFSAHAEPTTGAILMSFIAGSGSIPAVVGTSFFNDGFVDDNFTFPVFENITIRTTSMVGVTHVSPVMSGMRLDRFAAKQLYNCTFFTESDPTLGVEPTAETYGARLSSVTHTDIHSVYVNLTAIGYRYGFRVEEHDYWDRLNGYSCYAVLAIGSIAGAHPIMGTGGPVTANWCKYGIIFLGDVTGGVYINYYAEHWPGPFASRWYDAVADVHFPSSCEVYGTITGTVLEAGGADLSLIVSGSHTGTLRVIDLREGFVQTVGGKIQPTTNAQGGNGWSPGFGTPNQGALEINRGLTASTDAAFAVLGLIHQGQSGTSNAVGSIQVINLASADADKRLYTFSVLTNGAVDAGRLVEFLNSGSGLVQVSETTSASHRFAIPVYFGGVATAPTAKIHIAAGSATAATAPIKFTTGTVTTAAVAGQMEYNNTFHLTNSDATRRHVVLAASATKTTAGAPYTNDGYVTINVGGTDVRVMTTA